MGNWIIKTLKIPGVISIYSKTHTFKVSPHKMTQSEMS